MGKVMMSGIVPQLSTPVVPPKGLELSTIAEGSTVYINENGSPVAFYVAKHNYEQSLNGAGRTLLVRKQVHSLMAWDDNGKHSYQNSTVDSWLNGTYKASLDSIVRSVIGQTKFYCTGGHNGYSYNDSVITISRSVFLLSLTEYGISGGGTLWNIEGSALPIASANLRSSDLGQWTRSSGTGRNREYAYFVDSNDFFFDDNRRKSMNGGYVRPCFTIPSTALFDEETLLFKEVS